MKRKYILLIFAFVCVSFYTQGQNDYFYYYQGEEIPLQVDYSRMTVVSNNVYSVSNPTFMIENTGISLTRSKSSTLRAVCWAGSIAMRRQSISTAPIYHKAFTTSNST